MADKPTHRVVMNEGNDYVLKLLNKIDWIQFETTKKDTSKDEIDGLLFRPALAGVVEQEAKLFDSFVKETIGDPTGRDICIWVASMDACQKEEVIKKFGLVEKGDEKGCNWHFEGELDGAENVVEWFRQTFETRALNLKPAKH